MAEDDAVMLNALKGFWYAIGVNLGIQAAKVAHDTKHANQVEFRLTPIAEEALAFSNTLAKASGNDPITETPRVIHYLCTVIHHGILEGVRMTGATPFDASTN